jgi:outer membrane immunogenic protein
MDVIVAGDSASSGGAFVSHDAAVFPAAEVVMAMMKQLLFAAIGIVVFGASAACAADMGPPVYKAPYPVPPPPLYSWTGFYVGANGGFGGNNVNYSSTIAGVTGNTSLNSSGFLGGGQAGFNWQVAPSWVIGVETDFDGTNISSNASASTPFASANAGTKTDWFGTVRGRAGFLVTPVALLYGTGGWAYGHTTSSATATAFGFTESVSSANMQNGWTAGGGLEYAINPWLSLKTEYLYVNLGSANLSGVEDGVPITVTEKTAFHTVKAGLNFKFGGWTP